MTFSIELLYEDAQAVVENLAE